jgi:hypothetical protein
MESHLADKMQTKTIMCSGLDVSLSRSRGGSGISGAFDRGCADGRAAEDSSLSDGAIGGYNMGGRLGPPEERPMQQAAYNSGRGSVNFSVGGFQSGIIASFLFIPVYILKRRKPFYCNVITSATTPVGKAGFRNIHYTLVQLWSPFPINPNSINTFLVFQRDVDCGIAAYSYELYIVDSFFLVSRPE